MTRPVKEALNLSRVITSFLSSGVESTHYKDCRYIHEGCAIQALVDELEYVRALLQELDTTAAKVINSDCELQEGSDIFERVRDYLLKL